jgi:hypothetical protein
MKIILLSVNKYKEPYPVYPLSLDYVAGAISSKHDVLILDNNLYKEHEKLLKDIENYNPDMIGFSIRNIDNTSINDSQGFIEYYKEVIKSIKNMESLVKENASIFFLMLMKKT